MEVFLILSIILSFYFSLDVKSKRTIYIPKGSTTGIITYLNKNNYSLNNLDKYMIYILGYPQSGWIDLKSTTMSKLDFLYKLTTSKAAIKTVTLIPGETYYYFLKQISKKLNIPFEELLLSYKKIAYKLDGNIISQTYSLPLGMSSDDIIRYLINYSNKEYKKYSLKIFGNYNKKNWFKYITIASIIQKESASQQEMPIISSVIYNRLNKNMKLQMDGTLNYGSNSHLRVTPKLIKYDNSDYNTYKHKGIPKNPICAIEFNSIKSAIFPSKTNYLYFMKSVKGDKHIFTKSLKQHTKIIKKVQKSKRFKKYRKKLHKVTKKKKKKATKGLWKNIK